MSRLRHSWRGFIRYMQMSDRDVFAFVEGKTDPYFYGRICETVCKPVGIKYEICHARELPESAGGKQALLVFFEYLRRRSALLQMFKGERYGTIFFLDKDIDDLMTVQKRSPHVVYTQFYDVENYIFVNGDIINAAASSARLDRSWLENRIGDASIWRRNLAAKWKKWVVLCLFARQNHINAVTNYANVSRINNPLNADVGQSRYLQAFAALSNRSLIDRRQLVDRLATLEKRVDRMLANDEFDQVFKGKWYAPLFECEIRSVAAGRRIHEAGVGDRMVGVLLATLNFELGWADDFKDPLEAIIAQL